ncbi:hypothetical protein R1sor_026099 [Riccia sorocarpa]|uniref:Uncharacterized protein n=1 Tax=Riccia sorocarpa TaxID=122646 RepID=A0ABD3GE31_9MARC
MVPQNNFGERGRDGNGGWRRRGRDSSSSHTGGGSYSSGSFSEESRSPSPQRPRVDLAAQIVICHCTRYRGQVTKTARAAQEDTRKWGRHDEGQSSRAPAHMPEEVSNTRFDDFCHTLFQSRLRAILDRGPPPSVSDGPPVDPEIFAQTLAPLRIRAHTSHMPAFQILDPTPVIHVDPTYVVQEPPMSPSHMDIIGSSHPMIYTPPRTRRGPRGSCSYHSEALEVIVPSRVVLGGILLTGHAAAVLSYFDPRTLEVPSHIPIDEEITIWGRRWIVKNNTLGTRAGLGVFACEDIYINSNERPVLFPYIGPVYRRSDWQHLLHTHRSGFRTYVLDVDARPGCDLPRSERRYIDGDPARSPVVKFKTKSNMRMR